MIYPITVYGEPLLRKVAEPINNDFQGLKELIDDMYETMYHSDGVGLAAPQIGKSLRIFVIDATPAADDEPELEGFKKAFINPEIVERRGDEWMMNEGCLSLPEIREDVSRPEFVRIKYLDENLVEHIEEYGGFAARVIQHEYDHLDGKLFIDYLTPLKKRMLKSKLTAISKGKVNPSYRIVLPGKK
ncbi:peptide deformylase [Gaoshiqia sp. Z1-71]|uniref:peptide deformylase n=1 Tax=Gaoshiqia hydrogeniformans TaxID=3290090 RepID=UPI003BF7D92A